MGSQAVETSRNNNNSGSDLYHLHIRAIKSRGMRWAGTYSTLGVDEKCRQNISQKHHREDTTWEIMCVDVRITLKWTSKKYGLRVRTEFM
jgi:hypothetical protein